MDIVFWCVVYFLFSVCFYISGYLRLCERMWRRKCVPGAQRVLLVIAHPDDECMFFGPTIAGLLKNKLTQLYVLCLSIGDFEGKGSLRKDELWKSCNILGIPSENITLLNYEHLRDDPATIWPIEIVRRVLLSHICSLQIDTVITFDEHGITGHLNHTACYKSVQSLMTNKLLPSYCKAYALDSVTLLRKYIIAILDVPACYLFSPIVYIIDGSQSAKLVAAMKCHASQYVWFRKLYVRLSRYLVVNTLTPIIAEGIRGNYDKHQKLE